MSDLVTVVAVADKEPVHDYLIKGWNAFNMSLKRFGHSPVILGWNQTWKGLGSKPKLLKKAIENDQIDSEYLIFSDALDVAFIDSPEAIVEEFNTFYPEDAIVWNAERNCFPCAEWAQFHPDSRYPYKFLNSGLSVGRTMDFLQVLTEMKVDEIPDDRQIYTGQWEHFIDQHFFMEKFLFGQCGEHELKQSVDSQCLIFQTMVGETMDNFELQEGRMIYNKSTGTHPMAIHWNGPSKTAGTMDVILEHLDLL
jgi:hypothetical protein